MREDETARLAHLDQNLRAGLRPENGPENGRETRRKLAGNGVQVDARRGDPQLLGIIR